MRHLGRPVRRRIIPARAGFTAAPASSEAPTEDHPRSRGVYPLANSRPRSVSGSSPLARGLPPAHAGLGTRDRIIPARAGFTARPALAAGGARDHPRSRGVYIRPPRPTWSPPGSSPLARGLPRRSPLLLGGPGIIPARAGFTQRVVLPVGGGEDHPRSRGVYTTPRSSSSSTEGSSPLARGLLRSRASRFRFAWIIPARAGFTGDRRLTHSVGGDHPRSRGVYWLPACGRGREWGSSPLARGLRPGSEGQEDR